MSDDLLQIRGHVEEQAVVGVVANTNPPVYRLCFTVVPAMGLPYACAQNLGSDPSAEMAARAKARLLKRGAMVIVFATHVQLRSDHGKQVLAVKGITDVMPMNVPQNHAHHNSQEHSNAR